MATSQQSLRYVFYGGVEGAYQNQDLDDPRFFEPIYGATVGGYDEGQQVGGFFELSGEALAIANSVPRGAEFVLTSTTPGFTFFFEQPRVGDYTQANIVTSARITLGGDDAPLSGLNLIVFDGADGPNVRIGPTFVDIRDDNDAEARIDGLWLPENIVPAVVNGTDEDDVLAAFGQYNFLFGGDGSDSLYIKGGAGWAWGGFGNDLLDGGKQGDHLLGGYGNDTVYGHSGNDVIRGGDGEDILWGEPGNDTILGGSGSDSIVGGTGDDVIAGQYGNDTMIGGIGADTLSGGRGNDVIDGGSGNDRLDGGWGDDTMKGGSGLDLFAVSTRSGDGNDRILDFVPGYDKVLFESDQFDTFQEMLGNAVQVGTNTVITYGQFPTSTLTLENIRISQLRASDFVFTPVV